jgi:hypothetical protein
MREMRERCEKAFDVRKRETESKIAKETFFFVRFWRVSIAL